MDKAISSDLIRGHIDTIILQTLITGDKFPQQISDEIEIKSNNKYQINQATLYSSLKRLETLKYVKSYWNDAKDGRRKYYNLTESGKNFIDEALSNWSYSRNIIDNLVGFKAVQEVKIVREIVNVKDNNENNVNPIAYSVPNLAQNTVLEQKTQQASVENDSKFRNIINGLLKLNEESIKKQEEPEKIVENLAPISKNAEKTQIIDDLKPLKFNETISDVEYISKKDYSVEKIDFSDLKQQTEKEGYQLRISSIENLKNIGKILINKLNLISSILLLFIYIIEFIIIKNFTEISLSATFGIIAFGLIYPFMCVINYIKNTSKTHEKIANDNLLISVIIFFNVLLISFALNLLLNVNYVSLQLNKLH